MPLHVIALPKSGFLFKERIKVSKKAFPPNIYKIFPIQKVNQVNAAKRMQNK